MALSKSEIKFLRSLQLRKFREKEQLFVVEGVKLVKELLSSENNNVHSLYMLSNCSLEIPDHIQPVLITPSELERISGLKSPNQALAIAHCFEAGVLDPMEQNLVLLLEELSDPGNFGTLIRTADWFGLTQIICSPKTVDLYNPKVVQASMGSIFRMKIIYSPLLLSIEELRHAGFKIYIADVAGSNLYTSSFPAKTAIVLGSESHGISAELIQKIEAITIPKVGQAESLNVSIASAILMANYVQHQ